MSPTPVETMLSVTSPLVSIILRESTTEVTEPSTSPLIITLKTLELSATFIIRRRSEEVTLAEAVSSAMAWALRSAILRAVFSSATSTKRSPKFGKSLKPVTVTGTEGVALPFGFPRKSSIVRTLPKVEPATINSPTLSSPPVTSKFTTEPRPVSMWDSITRPSAGISISALSSSISAVSRIISSN